ncbi:DNA repair protein RadA [Methylococcus sp. EFPC2]|uniref:DNA repair protein RadA n=1 Tax=Methylococcus sp. EFPC2 TaxID=2812648 RepID=UPI0019673D37|nr:DNA repair protein RadA [Methylococcus sp. EFPC2]QSA98548.1 DNA repair protein RadA [Methylococcus sp. EFPC2]
MSKPKDAKIVYRCTECGHAQTKWAGQCGGCGLWNTLVESIEAKAAPGRYSGYAGSGGELAHPVDLSVVEAEEVSRASSGLDELDRVLGGGMVAGSAILIGGDPGIGKSTLLLQTLAALAGTVSTLYITGEESIQQVSLRAKRLNLACTGVKILAETSLERMLAVAREQKHSLLVVDSIQTVYTEVLQSAPGSVAQVRECAAQLVRFAKQSGTTLFLVGHVTKEGALAGPRVLEHMVDTVLYFEGDPGNRFRVIRAFKNRFGAVNELGVFAMTETGLKEVKNPSAIFLSRYEEDMPGSIVTVMREGSRPLLVEVQALVDESHLAAPRRVAVGMEGNRLAMLLAVLHRHGGVGILNQDVFINLVGGLRLTETAGDLAVALSVASSLRDRPIPRDWLTFGELGLSGEVRPVQNGEERLREAAKHGFRHAVAPHKNVPRGGIPGLDIIAVKNLREALAVL